MSKALTSEAQATALAMLRSHGASGVFDAIEAQVSAARDRSDNDGLIFWYMVRQALDNMLLQQRPPDATVH
jgi:hypothetical protein